MDKIEIYKIIVEINRTIETATLYIKKDLDLPTSLIESLDKIGDMTTTIEAYWKMSNDTNIIAEIEKINRSTLFQINSWRIIDQKTRISITDCIRSLQYIIKQGVAGEPQQVDTNTVIQGACIVPDGVLQRLKDSGMIDDANSRPIKWLKSKALLAYFADVANDKLSLKHGEKRTIRPFEVLFGKKGLTSAINDYKKTGDFPIGNKDIDDLFAEE